MENKDFLVPTTNDWLQEIFHIVTKISHFSQTSCTDYNEAHLVTQRFFLIKKFANLIVLEKHLLKVVIHILGTI